ncbi:MAG: hypothetical protein U1D35_13270 [Paracoccaceae bacterium]|nr:hypothetical protein [Paracoccaceae bacterium]
MRGLLVIILMIFPTLSQAQTVVVRSGDHDGFSRLVLEIGAVVDWAMGRTEDGYEFQLASKDRNYDLSQVYKLISHDRLSAIGVDPVSGNLLLKMSCVCHAQPFEFRPGVVVIDLRDGRPPAGSSFELTLDEKNPSQPLSTQKPRALTRPVEEAPAFDWLRLSKAGKPSDAARFSAIPIPAPGADLAPLRDNLMRQLSDGATRGVVQMTVPSRPDAAAGVFPTPEPVQRTQIRIGAEVSIASGLAEQPAHALTADGGTCVSDEQLDILTWGGEGTVASQMGSMLTGLIGEFDRPDPEAVQKAVRFYLYLGFGAEALQLLRSLDVAPADLQILETMAHVLDGDSDPDGAFAGMMACETSASLWAILASPEGSAVKMLNTTAIMRSFSLLPLHLRRHLGPALTKGFLARGDTETARSLVNAILRAPGDPGQGARLVEAALDQTTGKPGAAKIALGLLAAENGPNAVEALIALIDARVAGGETVEPDLVTNVAALAQANRGTELGKRLLRSHALALASSGDFDAAFMLSKVAPDFAAEIWGLLAQSGPDTALLTHAVLPKSEPLPEVPLDTRRQLSERLIALGFADPALHWLPNTSENSNQVPPDDRLLAARAQMLKNDAHATLRLLAGLHTPDADHLRAEAQARLGNHRLAAELFAALGETDAEQRAAREARAWDMVSREAEEPWKSAARLVVAAPEITYADNAVALVAPYEPLASGRKLLEESGAARENLKALLVQVPSLPVVE